MSTLDDVRTLRDTSLRLLPGFCQARATMDMAIEWSDGVAGFDPRAATQVGQISRKPAVCSEVSVSEQSQS
jgi:hypothetical protein